MASVLLLGGTGLVGRACLRRLLAEPSVDRIVVPARRPPAEPPSPRLAVHVMDLTHLADRADLFMVDQVICALGTTMRRAGSEAAFRAVDHDLPLAAARAARAARARHFLLVSSLGADAGSRVFYSRVKGEVEEALRKMDWPSLTIVRPSLLLGDRAEFRPGEWLAQRLGWLVPGRYAPIHADAVAAALVRLAREDAPGTRVVESSEMRRWARTEGGNS